MQVRRGPVPGNDALTVGDLAQRPAILAGDADRMTALFGQAGIVEHQHAGSVRPPPHLVAQPAKHGLVSPRTPVDELLQRLVIASNPHGQRLDRFALSLSQQTLQIFAAPVAPFAPA